MAFEGWLQFAGVEVINNSRTGTYARRMGSDAGCACPDLAASLGDPPYTSPEHDPAPWYDESAPESTQFLGLLGLEMTGAADGTTTRSATELLDNGAVLGPARAASREIEVKATAIATSRDGLSYGIGWLDTALAGSACHTGCGGDSLCVYTACPEPPAMAGDCGPAEPVSRWDWDPVAAGDRMLRQLLDVARTEGPTLDQVTHVGAMWYGELSFTITAGNPWWWRMPWRVFDRTVPPDYTDQVPNYEVIPPEPCPPPVDCMDTNPYCSGDNRPWPDEPFPGSNPSDLTLMDPCFPTAPFTARRIMWRVPSTSMFDWNATAPLVTISTGKAPLRRMTLRWYTNPRNQRPTGELDRCDACVEMTLPWIPDRTTVTLDSRTHGVGVVCRGQGATPSSATVYGPHGGSYQWPVFDCAVPLIAELVALDSSITPELDVRVEFAARVGVA